jgi:hypothetical protein
MKTYSRRASSIFASRKHDLYLTESNSNILKLEIIYTGLSKQLGQNATIYSTRRYIYVIVVLGGGRSGRPAGNQRTSVCL